MTITVENIDFESIIERTKKHKNSMCAVSIRKLLHELYRRECGDIDIKQVYTVLNEFGYQITELLEVEIAINKIIEKHIGHRFNYTKMSNIISAEMEILKQLREIKSYKIEPHEYQPPSRIDYNRIIIYIQKDNSIETYKMTACF